MNFQFVIYNFHNSLFFKIESAQQNPSHIFTKQHPRSLMLQAEPMTSFPTCSVRSMFFSFSSGWPWCPTASVSKGLNCRCLDEHYPWMATMQSVYSNPISSIHVLFNSSELLVISVQAMTEMESINEFYQHYI